MTPTIIDIEASGFGAFSYPIEVGIATAEGQRHSLLINPATDWTHWDAFAESLHGISRQTLLSYGKPVSEVAQRLNALLSHQVAYSDGWVVDKPWINRLFQEARVSMMFQLSPIEQLMTEAQFECWDSVKLQTLDEHPESRHRASFDAWIIQQTYIRSRRP